MQVEEQVALAPLTTFGVGGAARWFASAKTEEDVVDAVEWARTRGRKLFVLGGGSNLLVGDAGFDGLVLRMEIGGVAPCGDGCFDVGAGVSWDEFVSQVVSAGYAGVECLAGIPGSVGGTPVQNVGAYGQEVSETIEAVRAFDCVAGSFVWLDRGECRFRYRESRFNVDEPGRFIVVKVRFRLRMGGTPELKYADLRKWFGVGGDPTHAQRTRMNGAPGINGASGLDGAHGLDGEPGLDGAPASSSGPLLAEVAAAVREIRRSKGMLLVAGDADCRSAGSFFKNPVVDVETFARVREGAAGMDVPHWDVGGGRAKLPAAWLLEQAGFVKGSGDGPVGISSRHTLALVNRGDATFADVERFQREIVRTVREKFGVELVREPVLLG